MPLVKSLCPSLFEHPLTVNTPVGSIQETSSSLAKIVVDAWECEEDYLSPDYLPTILGRTQPESFLVLQKDFTDDDLPAFRAILDLPKSVTDVLDAFVKAYRRDTVTIDNVKKLRTVTT